MSESLVINPHGMGLDVSDKTIEEMFPFVDPEFTPFGSRVVVQIRRIVNRTKAGIILSSGTKDEEAYNGRVAKVIAVGPLAYKNRTTMEPWPEGIWAKVGDFVKIKKWDGERWVVDLEDGLEPIMFAVLEDKAIIGVFTGDVRKVRSHLV